MTAIDVTLVTGADDAVTFHAHTPAARAWVTEHSAPQYWPAGAALTVTTAEAHAILTLLCGAGLACCVQ